MSHQRLHCLEKKKSPNFFHLPVCASSDSSTTGHRGCPSATPHRHQLGPRCCRPAGAVEKELVCVAPFNIGNQHKQQPGLFPATAVRLDGHRPPTALRRRHPVANALRAQHVNPLRRRIPCRYRKTGRDNGPGRLVALPAPDRCSRYNPLNCLLLDGGSKGGNGGDWAGCRSSASNCSSPCRRQRISGEATIGRPISTYLPFLESDMQPEGFGSCFLLPSVAPHCSEQQGSSGGGVKA